MAKYSAVKATVNAYIKQNGRKEITGRILNAVLNATIDSLGKYFQFAGGATSTDDPGTPDQNVCYLAGEPGVYTNFGGITIENEEVALLFWNGEWTKQRILIGIREVNASVDNQVGTPSVDVSYSGGELVLTFHNLKGEQGETGDPAGFGTIGADINGGVGTPGVSVETSGDNTAKNLMFHFTNLKGETGVTSVVATIDDTSGTPSCQVSLVGQQLTLAFSGLKGLKGDTGVSADYPITIYNGLDSDATDQALSAAQGKVLDGKVSQLGQEVNDIKGEDGTIVTGYGIVANEYVSASDGSFVSYIGWSRTTYVPIGNYSSIKIQGTVTGYNWLYAEDKTPVANINLNFGTTIDLSNYPTAKYIALSDTSANIANLVITAYGYKGNTLTSLDNRIKALEQVTIPDGYMFGGEVTPSSYPSGEGKEFYLAKENGVYANFGGISILDEVAFLREVETENLLHLDTLIPNKYIDTQGAVSDYNGWTASQKMSVEAGTTYKVVALVNGVWTNMSSIFFAFYDASDNMTHRGVTTEWVLMESLEGDVTLAISWDTHTIGESPMLVPSDFNPTSYIEPSGWNKDTIVSLGESSQTEIVLPSKLAFVQDKQFDMMVDNILYRGSAKNVGFKNLGSSTMYAYPYEDRIRINQPNEVISGTAVVRIQSRPDCAFDKNPAEQSGILYKSFTYRSVLKTQGSGVTKKVMFIGDSITANGVYAREIVNLFANDDMAVQLIGTLGESPANHEGRGGWSAEDYCTKASYNDYANAFYNPTSHKFDFSYYMSENGFAGVDYVFISLGINDVYNQTKPLSESKYDAIISYYNEMITSIRAYNSSIKIFIGLPILPANSDWALSYNSEIMKAERLGLIQRLIQEYDGRESEGFVLVPLYCVVDTERDFPTESRPICARDSSTVEYVTDQTHPKTQGYYKIADVMFTYIKYGTTL